MLILIFYGCFSVAEAANKKDYCLCQTLEIVFFVKLDKSFLNAVNVKLSP